MIKRIAIEITERAFLPEAYIYHEYLNNRGFDCHLIDKGSTNLMDFDAVILFHGIHPFWKKYPKHIIGEYHSLSTGKFCRFRDIVKRVVNVKANHYIFLNDTVRKKLWFPKKTSHIMRPMGFHQKDFESYKNLEKKYDVIYAGLVREGVEEAALKLADLNLKILIVSPHRLSKQHRNIESVGPVKPHEARKLISQAEYGLNITPDVFPFNIQDATKVIEYCAAGLKVITNSYYWVDQFEAERKGSFLRIDQITSLEDIKTFGFKTPMIEDLSWENILQNSDFISLFQK